MPNLGKRVPVYFSAWIVNSRCRRVACLFHVESPAFHGVELRRYAIDGYKIVEHTFVVFCCGLMSVSNHSACSPKRPQRNDWQAAFSRRSWGELDSTNPPGPRLPFLQTHFLVRSGAPLLGPAGRACSLQFWNAEMWGWMGWCLPILPTKSLTMPACPPLHAATMAKHRPLFSALPSRGAKCKPVDRCNQSAIVHAG